MITQLLDFLAYIALPINLICHLLIFIGTLYVAIHNRKIPRWHVTVLWYCGLSSLFTALTIVIEWIFGQEFPLSYYNIGIIGETFLHACLAFMATSVFLHTVWTDLHQMKNRHPAENKAVD